MVRIKDSISENDLVDLFVERMKNFATKESRGTYNRQDPTAYENYTCVVPLMYGFSKAPYDPTDDIPEFVYEQCAPDPEDVTVHINDCTWGITFEFETSRGTEKGYWSRGNYASDFNGDGGEWVDWCSENFHEVLMRLFFIRDEEVEEEDPFGCPAMYE